MPCACFGAELVEVPAVPYTNPNNYVKYSGRLASARCNDDRRPARSGPTSSTTSPTAAATTRPPAPRSGPQTGGKVDGFICAVGSGGTLAGVADGLKERKPDVVIGIADPHGAALYSWYTTASCGRGHLDHRGHRPGPHHRQSRRRDRSTTPTASRIAKRWRSCSICSSMKGCARRLLRHQCRRRHPARQGARPGPHHRDHALRSRAPATSPACSIPTSCARRTCPCRLGWSAGAATCRSSSKRSRAEMTELLFRDDPYLRDCEARVVAVNARGGVILDRTVFYADGRRPARRHRHPGGPRHRRPAGRHHRL